MENIVMIPYPKTSDGIYPWGTILRCTPDSGLGDKPFILKQRSVDDVHRFYPSCTPQNLYQLSDEEIKKGDWMLDEGTNIIHQCFFDNFNRDGMKKIIASTNIFLYLPIMDNDTIEEFIKSKQVIIKNIEPELVEFFEPNGTSLGLLNEYQFLDLCVQIKNTQSEGYYYYEGEQKKYITKNGRIVSRKIFMLHTELLKGIVGF